MTFFFLVTFSPKNDSNAEFSMRGNEACPEQEITFFSN